MQISDCVIPNLREVLAFLADKGPEVRNVPEYQIVMDHIYTMQNSPQNDNVARIAIIDIIDAMLALLRTLHYLKNHSVMYLFDLEQGFINSVIAYLTQEEHMLRAELVPQNIEKEAYNWKNVIMCWKQQKSDK